MPGTPLLMPNAWDEGSARLFAAIGCGAIATTSGGFAASRGKLDGALTRAEVLAHCADLTRAVGVPVSADLENGFADDPAGVAATINDAIALGLAGGSVEDFTGHRDDPIYEVGHAAERVRAAAEAAHNGPVPFVLTARAENYLHGRVDLADTIARLQAYEEAGADVLFAPRVVDPAELQASSSPPSTVPGERPHHPGRAADQRAGRARRQPDLCRRRDRRGLLWLRRRGGQGTPGEGDAQLLGEGRRRPRRHTGRIPQTLSATVTSISTAPPRGSAATPTAERVWRPASPNTSASTRLAPSTTAGCSWKSGAEAT